MSDELNAVRAETDAGSGVVLVPLGDHELAVLPPGSWRSSALRALKEGDFDTWAAKCLEPDSLDVWLDIDPTVDEIERFFAAWETATGQNVGKSSASQRSSKSTARL